jgi:hypothetical protein
MKRDAMITIGMLLTVAGTLFACFRFRLVFTRIGFVISAVAVCVGLAYFGWLPLFGGSYSPDTFFGSVILYLGLLGLCLFATIEEVWLRLTVAPEAGRGFPVVQPDRRPEEPGQPADAVDRAGE